MKVSKRCEYAIRALMELGRQSKDVVCNLRQISRETRVPFKFLEQIMMDLKRGGWVLSVRGKEGGYRLRMHPKEISLGDVLTRMDEGMQVFVQDNALNENDKYSGFYQSLQQLQENYLDKLQRVTVWDLCEKSRAILETRSKQIMYHI